MTSVANNATESTFSWGCKGFDRKLYTSMGARQCESRRVESFSAEEAQSKNVASNDDFYEVALAA